MNKRRRLAQQIKVYERVNKSNAGEKINILTCTDLSNNRLLTSRHSLSAGPVPNRVTAPDLKPGDDNVQVDANSS